VLNGIDARIDAAQVALAVHDLEAQIAQAPFVVGEQVSAVLDLALQKDAPVLEQKKFYEPEHG
jgi:hypothetical protein